MAGPYNADNRFLSEKGITPAFLKKLNAELQAKGLKLGDPLFVRILRKEKQLQVWMQPDGRGVYKHFTTLPIQKDSGGVELVGDILRHKLVDREDYPYGLGPKRQQGDSQAVEGFYNATVQRSSEYHLALAINYPNDRDRKHGNTGGEIKVHGGARSDGCFAIGDILDPRIGGDPNAEGDLSPRNNTRMNMLYALANEAAKKGQQSIPVHVFPFAMTQANMAAHKKSPWVDFWKQLKPGYDSFESGKRLPEITVVGEGEHARYAVKDATPVLVQMPQPATPSKRLVSSP